MLMDRPSDSLVRVILDILGETGGRRDWTTGTLAAVARDRGLPDRDVKRAIDLLREKKCVAAVGEHLAVTDRGKERLRRLRATAQFNIRLPNEVREELAPYVGRVGDTESSVAVRALTEWTRMLRFPGIDFRWTPSGRKPHVTGTGLSVWELYHLWLDHERHRRRLLDNYPDLTPGQLGAALAYAGAFLHEMPADEFGKQPPSARRVEV